MPIFENPSLKTLPIYSLATQLSHPSLTMLPSLTNKKPKKGTTITLAKSEEAKAQVAVMIGAVEPQSFPNLKEAVNSKPKKKKGTTIMLSEFNHGGFDQGHMRPEMHTLPTGPKELSTEEMQFNRLGGDFSSYD